MSRMSRTLRLAPALLALPVLLSACGPAASSAAPTAAKSPAAGPSAPSSAAAAGAAAASGPVKTALGKSFTDPQTGDQVTVVDVVRGFPAPAKYADVDKEVVLVHIKATTGQKFYTGIYPDAFSILEPGSDIPASEDTSLFADAMTAAGYPTLPGDEVGSGGKTGEGWLAISLRDAGKTGLRLQYKRAAATVIGSKQGVPKFTATVPLPDLAK